MYDYRGDSNFFPVTKAKLLQSFSDEQNMAWLAKTLPDQTFKDADQVMSVLVRSLPAIEWMRQPSDLMWKFPGDSVFGGQHLVVGENQQAVMLAAIGDACDIFTKGDYTISATNLPLLLSKSRRVPTGYEYLVLDGTPVFLDPGMEFEIDCSATGQSKALRRVMAKGNARVKISSPRTFVEKIAKKSGFNTQSALQNLGRSCAEAIKREMSTHELDELSSNSSILEKSVSGELKSVGLDPLKITFDYVGEVGIGAFAPSSAMMNDPQKMEQMKKMAESMRAAQLAQMEKLKPLMEAQQQRYAAMQQKSTSLQTGTVICQSCGRSNPQTSKFCGECGKPLLAGKVCPKCGKQSEPTIKFCGNCGTLL